MTTDNREEGLGAMLRKGVGKSIPSGLQETIMQKVRIVEHHRIYRQLVVTFILRLIAVIFFLVLLIKIFLLRGTKVGLMDALAQFPEKISTAGYWLFGHPYSMLVVIVLALFSWRLKMKADA